MTIEKDTRLEELMQAYPWLLDEAEKLDPKFKILNNPIGKAFLKKATIEDLSKKAGLTVEEITDWLEQTIENGQTH